VRASSPLPFNRRRHWKRTTGEKVFSEPPGPARGRGEQQFGFPLAHLWAGDSMNPVSCGDSCMSELDAFRDAIRRIRAGDERAAAELVSRYEPVIRREVRLQLQDRRLARLFDS